MKKADIEAIIKNPLKCLSKMTEDDIASLIQQANYHYYNTDTPLFPDNIFDLIKEYLEKKNKNHPILKHVGAVVDELRKVKLPYYMGSMDKIKSDGNALTKWKDGHTGQVVVSDKLDGNSGMFYIKNGVAELYTRGNGTEGQKVTHMLPFISTLPNPKDFRNYPELCVRGEFIMTKEAFEVNKDKGANARNMVAGLLNAKIPNLTLAKHLEFVAYELITPQMDPLKQLHLLETIKFKVVSHKVIDISSMSSNTLSQILLERREKSDYEIDGIVVYHNAQHNRRVGENPKHAFAFKSVAMMDRAEVIVKEVEWNISKDGFLKPVLIFDPVSLSGASVKRATGINAKFIKDNKIGVGAKIVVMRSGDVIPKVIEIVEPATHIGLPEDVQYKWNETMVDIVVHNNTKAQSEVQFKELEFFFTKVKIPGLSTGTLRKFYNNGHTSVGSILSITKEEILNIDGFKDKMADKIHISIATTIKDITPIMLMSGSNKFGRGVGEKTLALVQEKFQKFVWESIDLSLDDLVKINGIEKKTAENIIQGISAYWTFARENDIMSYHNKKMNTHDTQPKEDIDNVFTGKSFIFTGIRDKNVEKYITDRGGEIKSSLSKNVNVLICKDPQATTSKTTKAQQLGVEIVAFKDFTEKYGIGK